MSDSKQPSTPKRSHQSSSSHHFAVPEIPQRTPKPLTMSSTPNIDRPSLSLDPALEPTPGKLKRLSLVARPPHSELSNGRGEPSTPRTTPRAMGMRSSIVYSPAPIPAPRSSALLKDALGRTGVDEGLHRSREVWDNEGEARKEKRRGETLTDKHADLLVLIAQKERRVNELRQELAQQESALATLKSRWTSIVSRSRPPAIAPTITSTTSASSSLSHTQDRPVSASSSTSSSISSLATLSETGSESNIAPLQSDDGEASGTSFKTLLDSAWGQDGVLSPQTIEGGKRFWGALVRTVGAAAGGTVPTTEDENGSAALDLSSLKGMLPAWSLSPTPTPAPAEPANKHRLPSRASSQHSLQSSPTVSSRSSSTSLAAGSFMATTNTTEQPDLLSGGNEDVLGQAITPRKSINSRDAVTGRNDSSTLALSNAAEEEESDDVARLWEW
ncbi:hypothetical protein BCR39DRAFT_587990 [Naematelia encephala]|uniref:DUF4048 domain-containing protein n=1 Tax=Naematelia encephala TaxID=71784 RepID=A0A1Y2B6N5_9TREE|nr:hypothetical protein BCR39DRAFT_587990 [Naematelia encephala]